MNLFLHVSRFFIYHFLIFKAIHKIKTINSNFKKEQKILLAVWTVLSKEQTDSLLKV